MAVVLPTSGVQPYDFLGKIVIVGDSGVGKTSLLMRYSDDTFSPHYTGTIGVDFKTVTLGFSEGSVKLQIWDTAGQERFRGIVATFYRGAHAMLVCFDLTDRETFLRVPAWVQEIRSKYIPLHPEDPPLILALVGCKADLKRREVRTEEAQQMAKQFGFEHYFETTATDVLDGKNPIAVLFDSLARAFVSRHTSIRAKKQADDEADFFKGGKKRLNAPEETEQASCLTTLKALFSGWF